MTEIPKELNELLEKLGVIKLFTTVPGRALSPGKNRKPPVLLVF